MTRASAVALTLVAAASAAGARASDTGLTLGARIAYGVPLADAGTSLPLGTYASGSLPVVVEAGWRFTRELSAGAYFQYAYATADAGICAAIPPAARTSGSTCSSASGHVLRYGLQGVFRFPVKLVTPWMGLGVGAESASMTTTVHIPAVPSVSDAFNGDIEVRRSTSVVGEVNLQGGVELKVARRFSVGPFATVTLARYTHAPFAPDPWGFPEDIPSGDQAWHEWLLVGAKGTFDL